MNTTVRRPRSRVGTAAVVALVAAALVAIGVVAIGNKDAKTHVAAVTPAAFPAGQRLSGVVVPGSTTGETFGAWRGRAAQVIVSYVGTKTWDGATQVAGQGLLTEPGPGVRRVYSIPLIPTDVGATLLQGAAGRYDGHFRTLAQQLVKGGQADATLRIGWEMTGDWFAWSGVRDPVAWVNAYRHAVDAMRSVPGQHFAFDWTVALGAADPGPLYPGDGYVDLVGADVYDVSFSVKATDHEAVWHQLLTKPYGLDWLAGFAADHGKRISFSEWGLEKRCDGHGGGDDPAFIDHMHDWMNAHDVAYEAYFNTQDKTICATFAIDGDTFPRAAARYKSLFGGITSSADTGSSRSPGA
ncbi:hypothetical protein acdb102_13890 [Acidothermaceae bacterium B102]|nr:hypothetical protein acdb102_13890 [Acidothermaceae bacterium B102]